MDATHALVTDPHALLGPDEYTRRKQWFTTEYLKDRDGPRAYKQVYGFSVADASAKSGAYRLLKDPDVAAAIRAFDDEQLSAVQKQTRVTLARVVARLAEVAFADIRQLKDADGNWRDLDQLPDDLAAALAGVDVTQTISDDGVVSRVTKYKLLDRNRTLDMLMQHLNGYEKHQAAVLDPLTKLLAGMKRSTVPVVSEVEDVDTYPDVSKPTDSEDPQRLRILPRVNP